MEGSVTSILNLATHHEPHVSVSELAEYWHVSERTIYRDIAKGALAFERVGSSGIIRITIGAARRYGRPDDGQPRQS